VYREFLHQIRRWITRAGRSDALALLVEEVTLIEYLGIFSEAWRGRLSFGRSLQHHPEAQIASGQASDK
jgi:hypothetical protein